jgi:hypothetical protein
MGRDAEDGAVSSRLELCACSSWQRALFTTYTLSLSLFEAYMLPSLARVGCGDILILVDEDFYLDSLIGRQAALAADG